MPYTIPSSVISPGAVYQPRQQIPAVISQNARALYYTRGGSISGSLLLDQSSLNSGTRRTGEEGRCYTGDGTDDYVTTGTSGTSINGKPASIMAWVKISSSRTVFSYPFGAWGSAASRVFCIFTGLSANQIWVAYDNATPMNFTFAGLEDSWHHVAATFDGVNLNLYIDGVLRNQAADTEVSGTSFDAAFLGRNNGTNVCKCSIFDVRYYADPLTQDNINYIYTFGKSGIDPTNSSLLAQYKCDEQSGTTAYDSSGNGNNGTLTNITAATFHATQDIWSFQNQVGFNTSGAVYIPREESDPANDVLGNPLTNIGRRPNDAALHSSNCLTADGTLYIAAAHLAGTETVVSSGGTSTPSISAGRIDFTAGSCWDLTLSDGTHYPLSEGWGVDIGSSTSDNDGVLTNSILANAWGATQNEYHYNLVNGFSLYEHASTAVIRWPFKNGSVKTLTPPTGYSKTSDNHPGNHHNNAETLIDLDPDSTPEMGATQLGITVPASHAFGDAFAASDQIFSRQRTLTEDRFVVMPEAQTGSALATIQKYTQP